MRIDDAGPRTWLLASVAAWALLAWVLAIAGMGGRVAPLPPDPALLKPLPRVTPTPSTRLGEFAEYGEVAARPLFTTDRRPRPFVLEGQGEAATGREFNYLLTGVMITPGLEVAILQPSDGGESVRVRLGAAPEPQPDWRLVELNPRSAVFEGPDGRRNLEMRVFDGIGGAAPTAVSGPRPPQGDTGQGDASMRDAADPMSSAGPDMAEPDMAVPAAPAPQRSPQPARPPETPTQNARPQTDQAQMEAIRQRILERRRKLRGDEESTKPPAPSP